MAGRMAPAAATSRALERAHRRLALQNKATAMDLVNRLLAMGVDPNHELTRMRPNGNGRGRFADYMMRGGTGPLMIAALSYDDEAIKALLAHGAEVDAAQCVPDHPADGRRRHERLESRWRRQCHWRRPVHQQVDLQARAIETIDLLLDAGANINARVTNSHTHTAKLVAYVQGRDHEGQTALFAAAEAGWDKVVKHLIDRGADPTSARCLRQARPRLRSPSPPPFPGSPPPSPAVVAGRDATIALLETLSPKSGADTTAAK